MIPCLYIQQPFTELWPPLRASEGHRAVNQAGTLPPPSAQELPVQR